ncbi:MAG: tetratricopeptide repeat protein [Fusobacteriota bacterium]
MKLKKIKFIVIIMTIMITVLSFGEEKKDDIKQEASFLYSVQSYNEGIEILEKEYDENKNDIEYIFLLGKGYYQLKEYKKASKYFERALGLNSNLTGIRIKYADSLVKISKVEKAKKNYNLLLNDENLSKEDKKIIKKKLEKLSEKQKSKEVRSIYKDKNWNFNIEAGYTMDKNFNAIPENQYYRYLGTPFYSKEINKEIYERAMDFSLSGDVSIDIPRRNNLKLKLSSEYNTRQYEKYDLFSYDNVSLGFMLDKDIENININLPWEKETTWLNGATYSNSMIFSPSIKYLFDNKIKVGTRYKYIKNIYQGEEQVLFYEKNKNNSRSQHLALLFGYNWNKVLKINTEYSIIKENSDFDDYDNNQRQIGYELTGDLLLGISYNFKNMFSYKNYRKYNSSYEKNRKDFEKTIKFSISKKFYDSDIMVRYRVKDVDSNININDRNSKDISFILKLEI